MGRHYNRSQLQAIFEKHSHLSEDFPNSIPAFGTKKTPIQTSIEDIFGCDEEVCHQTVPDMQGKYPFKEARLVHYGYDMTKRWCVDCQAWDVSINKLRRYRVFEPLNRIKSLGERISTGEWMVRVINGKLRAGKILGKDKVSGNLPALRTDKLTILQGIDYVQEQKKLNGYRPSYCRTFATLKSAVKDWLEYDKQPDYCLKEFDRKDAQEFFAYLRDERKLSNKSINNLLLILGIAFKFIEKNGDRIWKQYPLSVIGTLPVISKKHAAYTNEQIHTIQKAIDERVKSAPIHRRAGYRQLQLHIRFIYYTLARPKTEIMKLKVADIEENRIYFRGEISKNKRDDYVPLSDALKKYIDESGIRNYPETHYVFGKDGVPGPEPLHPNFFWDKHNRILKETGLHDLKPFTLYSYKHTGAISLYLATKDVKIVQRMCRHQSIAQTDTYLRDLGVMSDYNEVKGWKGDA